MVNIKNIICRADTSLVRLLIATSSFLWAVMLFWPGDTFVRPTYGHMGQLAPENVWAAAFAIHFLITTITLTTKQMKYVSVLGEGMLGCLLWTSSCFLMLSSVYPPPAAIASEITTALASWWVLVRYNETIRRF